MKLPKLLAFASAIGLGVLGVVVLSTARPAAALTYHYQVVTVQASSSTATTAKLDLWQMNSAGAYLHVAGPIDAYVGERGTGTAHEGIARTPAGVFGLTEAFGNHPTNGTRLPYFQAGPADWWDGESGTPAYNTHVHQSAAPGPESENLYYAGAVYAHAVVIDYNRFPAVAGAGSAFFLHVTNNQPTAGCVAISSYALDVVMRWLNPALHPVISIGVGAQATHLITNQNAAAATHNPHGHLDTATTGNGTARLTGWAADPDSSASPLTVDAYLDGVLRGHYSTGLPRPDVARIMHTGPNQGFGISLTGLPAGNHTICVRAVNIKLGTTNPSLGCAFRHIG